MSSLAKRLGCALTVALALGAGATAALAADVTVRRVLPAVPATQGRGPSAAPMTPEELRGWQLREERERATKGLHVLMPPGGVADRSAWAMRRKGWTPSAGMRRGSLAGGTGKVTVTEAADTTHDVKRIAFIRIDFLSDRGGPASTGDGRFDLSGPDTNAVPIDRAPHNYAFYKAHGTALERYYDVQSFGHEKLEVDVWPDSTEPDSAYHLSDMADLGPWAFGSSDAVYNAAVRMMRGMFFAADSQSALKGNRIPWDTYDRFMFIHAGGDLQSDVKQDSKEDIPSFTVFLGDTNRIIFPDSTDFRRDNPIDRAAFVPETINQDGYYGALNGVIAHENGHNLFGFLDVYDIQSGYPVCGYWSLMDSGNLAGSRVLLKDSTEIYAVGILPPSIDPLQRGWLNAPGMDVREPAWGDTFTVAGNERSNVFYRLPLSSDEYLLIENRFLSPADTLLQLDADSVSHVILGPKSPDRFEYDALEPGGGLLVWHVDDSVIPYLWSLRVNEDYGLNSNWSRQGLQIIEADGLDDLGDPGSPYLLGSPLDPWQRGVNAVLSDSTLPNLRPNQGTFPHLRLDFLDDADSTMRVWARRTWQLPNFPVTASFPPNGPKLLAIDADGDRRLDVCWAGGNDLEPGDSTALFADGLGLGGGSLRFASLDRRPLPEMAAALTGDPDLGQGPAVFAVTTSAWTDADTSGGRVWLLGSNGLPRTGWPVRLPSHATTPPVIAGTWPNVTIYVGAADGYVYALAPDGHVLGHSDVALFGGVSGTLAFVRETPVDVGASASASASNRSLVAAGSRIGRVAVFEQLAGGGLAMLTGWPQHLDGIGFSPEFLWYWPGGAGANAIDDCAGSPTLVVENRDRLFAFCPDGTAHRGWGTSFGDSLVPGLGAGDPDGDGLPELLVQTRHSQVAFVNRDGRPSPGWPRAGTPENLRTDSPALAFDADGDGRSEIVTMNGSGVLAAMPASGATPKGWPLATGSGTAGSMLAVDLDRNGTLELVAPDRDGKLYAYSLPVGTGHDVVTSWTMLGGDPGRTRALPVERTTRALAPAAGPVVHGTLKAFPNPARRRPIGFAYTLTEDADVEFRILDASGHEVASFARRGQRAENLETWDPSAVPAGLYMARLRFRGAHGSQVFVLPVGVLR